MANGDGFPPPHPEAGNEIEEALLWHEERSPAAAGRLAIRLKAVVALAMEVPDIGEPHLFGTKRLTLQPLPYSLVYLVNEGSVFIVALAHAAREPGYWARRLE